MEIMKWTQVEIPSVSLSETNHSPYATYLFLLAASFVMMDAMEQQRIPYSLPEYSTFSAILEPMAGKAERSFEQMSERGCPVAVCQTFASPLLAEGMLWARRYINGRILSVESTPYWPADSPMAL